MVNTAAADPIVAIATGPGRGGIGIVRVSGAAISPVTEAVLGLQVSELVPRHAVYSRFLADDGAEIDRGIALYFPAPHSYTGENVLELQGHGGPVVLRMLLARCLRDNQCTACFPSVDAGADAISAVPREESTR